MARTSASHSKSKSIIVLAAVIALGILPGCDGVSAKRQFDDLLLHVIGRDDLVGKEPGASHPANPKLATHSLVGKSAGEAEKQNRINAELLHEVFRTVLMREPETPGEFGTLLGSLDQGASLEGIYNGMIHSATYRDLETRSPGAKPQSLQIFANELSVIQADMEQPTVFSAEAAKPLAKAVEPGGDDGSAGATDNGVATVDFNQPKSVRRDTRMTPEQLAQVFVGASVFTLKRVLGDEALHLVDEKRANPDALAHWYAHWVVHMAGLKVDFGLALRNQADEKFHYDWARSSSEDALVWEVLNRVHRAVNQAHWKKS